MPEASHVDIIQSLYRATSSCADHHDEKTIDLLHVETLVDRFIRDQASSGSIVFVTGNPGDGKTHALRKLSADLNAANVEVCLDANERSDRELLQLVDNAARSRRGCVIAINEGILVALLQSAAGAPWADDVKRQLLEPYQYSSPNAKDPRNPQTRDNEHSIRIRVVDLNLRNNLSRDIVVAVLKRHLECLAPCQGCPVTRCEGQLNAQRLAQPVMADRLVGLLDAVARAGYHATMRDLHGFVAFLLFGGRTCDDVKSTTGPGSPYWENAFEGGGGPLFDALSKFDPKAHPAPLLDDVLWRRADQAADWAAPVLDDTPAAMDLEERRRRFVSRKRRSYFEHLTGHMLLDIAEAQPDRLIRELQSRHKSPRDLVRLLNRFFDRNEDRGDVLFLWVSHRYDARPTRYAAFSQTVSTSDLEVLLPTLSKDAGAAFPNHHPDHVVLAHRRGAATAGLRVDRPLLHALLLAEYGLPSTFRRGEPEARIAAFYDRLARTAGNTATEPVVQIGFVDMDTGGNFHLDVDVPARRYQRR